MTDTRPMTLTGKILFQHAISPRRQWVEAGDVLRLRVDWTIASELAWNGMNRTYDALGRPSIHDRERFYLAIDHTVDPQTLANDKRTQALVALSRDFAKESNIRHFYDANETILHTKFYTDLVRPGDVVLGADSHTSSHGGLGAFAIGLGGADITVAMVLGETWIEVPEAIAVEYNGALPFGLTGKDVILKTLGELGRNTVALERTAEYVGDATASFSTDMRFTICNMTAEFGGLNGIFAPDTATAATVDARSDRAYRGGSYFAADADAPYVARYPIDLKMLVPQVAKPFAPDNVAGVDAPDVAGTKLDGVFVGACTTTEEELVLGALVLQQCLEAEEPVASDKRLVVPGSRDIVGRLRERGLLELYQRAGFRIGEPGCSMCLGVASDRAGEGEVWLSSQNRNFQNRMGKGSLAWLASAATVTASSISMQIRDPRPVLERIDPARFEALLQSAAAPGRPLPSVTISEPVPAEPAAAQPVEQSNELDNRAAEAKAPTIVTGRVQRFGDHVDTDAIIPGEFCHLAELEALGDACFHHVRPGFRERVADGEDIIVAGEGWGSGSSREQAVWSLQGAGVKAVIARSFAFIHKRNLVNEALPYLVMTDDAFYAACEEGSAVRIDLASNQVQLVAADGKQLTVAAEPPSPMVQALRKEKGIVAAIRHHGAQTFARLQGGA